MGMASCANPTFNTSLTFDFHLQSQPPSVSLTTNIQSEILYNKWSTSEYGNLGTKEYRIIFADSELNEISPWHNIPLYSEDGTIRCVCKTPKGSDVKYEVDMERPIPQLRLAQEDGHICQFSITSHWNIGMLPQTFCDSSYRLSGKFYGLVQDGKPLEVVEIGAKAFKTGQICKLKPICLVSISQGGMLTRFVIAIDVEDSVSALINSVEDMERIIPGTLSKVQLWLEHSYSLQSDDKTRRVLKMAQDNNIETVMEVIANAHASWQLYTDTQPEWLIKPPTSGNAIWKKYTIHRGISISSLSDLPSREIKYERAWFSSLDWDECTNIPDGEKEIVSKRWFKKRDSRVSDDCANFSEPNFSRNNSFLDQPSPRFSQSNINIAITPDSSMNLNPSLNNSTSKSEPDLDQKSFEFTDLKVNSSPKVNNNNSNPKPSGRRKGCFSFCLPRL